MTYVFAQAGGFQWDWEYAQDLFPGMLNALWQTVVATILGFSVGIVLGLVLAILRRSEIKVIRWPVTFFIEFVRSTPLLVQLIFIYFVFPDLGLTLSAFVTLIVGLGVHYGTYTSESYRAGIDNVERGQWEASTTLNLSTGTTWSRVILPQAIPTVIPALGNYLVAMFKDAPLAIAIGAGGIVAYAQATASRTFRPVEPYVMMGILFLAVSIPAALFVRYLERRYGYERE